MSKLPKYLHATASELGAGCVINTETGIIGRVVQFTDYYHLLTEANSGKWIAHAQVNGYMIILFYSGLIGRGNRLIDRPEVVQAEMEEMSRFYLREKITPHRSRYKRYLTNP